QQKLIHIMTKELHGPFFLCSYKIRSFGYIRFRSTAYLLQYILFCLTDFTMVRITCEASINSQRVPYSMVCLKMLPDEKVGLFLTGPGGKGGYERGEMDPALLCGRKDV